MKKFLGIALVLVSAIVPTMRGTDENSCACSRTPSHTFFSVRPQYQSASPERVTMFRQHPMSDDECAWGGDLELALFGGKSGKSSKLACYFTPFGKHSLTVAENPAAGADIIAGNFGIRTVGGGFQSTINFAPSQSVIGFGMTYRQQFNRLCDWDCISKFWFEISAPVERVRNTMGLTEVVAANGNDNTAVAITYNPAITPAPLQPVSNMVAAFAQTGWDFGRITGSHTKTGLADLELKFGYEWLNDECCFFESFLGILAPTGTKVQGVNVFEPIVGHNRHWGIMSGMSMRFKVWDNDCGSANFYIDTMSNYLFKRSEVRSFDLRNKPWSRYQAVYANFAQAAAAAGQVGAPNDASIFLYTPGINLLTREMEVKPRFSHTMNLGLAFNRNCWEAELGYNFFGREAECVSLKTAWAPVAALKASSGTGNTNPFILINNSVAGAAVGFVDEATFNTTVITAADLDLNTAAHPALISHTIYGSLGYKFDGCSYPMFLSLGGSYEFEGENTVLNRYNIWGKFGIGF